MSADSEEINEKSSTPVRRNSSLRTRRHQAARREPAKDVNKSTDDTVFYSKRMEYCCHHHNQLSLVPFAIRLTCFVRHLLLWSCLPSYLWFLCGVFHFTIPHAASSVFAVQIKISAYCCMLHLPYRLGGRWN